MTHASGEVEPWRTEMWNEDSQLDACRIWFDCDGWFGDAG